MTTDPTAPVPPDANGLREAVEALWEKWQTFDVVGNAHAHWMTDLTRLRNLAASEAAPTAGEREACGDEAAHPAHEHRTPAYMGDWKRCDGIPATPPADDASEGLSEAERTLLLDVAYAYASPLNDDNPTPEWEGLVATVNHLLAARVFDAEARARAEGAAEALREAADVIAETRRRGGYVDHQTAARIERWLRDRAASIARSDAAPDEGDATS